MATRAHIRVFDDSGTIMLYHHWDGYPNGIGSDLKKIVNEIYKDPEYGCRALIQNKLGLNDEGYAPALCLHGDEEFVYVIDCRDNTIKCYTCKWNDSFEDCFKAEREVPIPD